MRKWFKRLLLIIALLLVTLLAAVYGGFRMLKGAPDWYHRPAISPARREFLARRAFNKFATIQNAAALARQNQIIAGANLSSPSLVPIVISFSDDELNAFFEKWENFANWKSNYERYVDDPQIIVEDNQLILAGQVKEFGTVVSLQFDPRIDQTGRLDLHLQRVLVGELPLPGVFIRMYQDRLTSVLQENLPRWRQRAAIDANGAANSDLISASTARLFIHALSHTSADPVLFLPLVERRANVPVRIVDVKVEGHDVTMTVLPLDNDERSALLARIRADEPVIKPE
jgi:uncharacterized protein YpmS